MDLTSYQEHLIEWAQKDARSKTQDWPGFPLSQLPFAGKDDLHLLIDKGLLAIVERPSKTDPNRKATYVVATHTQDEGSDRVTNSTETDVDDLDCMEGPNPDECARHTADCDGFCDHLSGHRNACLVAEGQAEDEEDDEETGLQEKLDNLRYDDLTELFDRGVQDYTGGVEPEGWQHPQARKNPYLAGWLIASEMENGMEFFNTEKTEIPRTGLEG